MLTVGKSAIENICLFWALFWPQMIAAENIPLTDLGVELSVLPKGASLLIRCCRGNSFAPISGEEGSTCRPNIGSFRFRHLPGSSCLQHIALALALIRVPKAVSSTVFFISS